jgi:squalene-hopene/tetraprenyl-beta-curcumene cyclase
MLYFGQLTGAHLREVARVALVAHGFALPLEDYEAEIKAMQKRGGDWLERWSEWNTASRMDVPLRLLNEFDPHLWARLPWMAGLGCRIGEVLYPLAKGAPDGLPAAVELAGSFNTAIAFLDYLVDERQLGEQVFRALRPEVVASIFQDEPAAQEALWEVFQQSSDFRARCLIALVAHCAKQGQALLDSVGNLAAWVALGKIIERTLYAEARLARAADSEIADGPDELMVFGRTKSSLPAVAVLLICALGSGRLPGEGALQVATALGDVLWMADDLADIFVDLDRRTANRVLCRLSSRLCQEERQTIRDKDIYDQIAIAAEELVAQVAPRSFASPGEPLEHARKLSRFSHALVASWVKSPWKARSRTLSDVHFDPAESVTLDTALTALLRDQADGFREAGHQLTFPRLISGRVEAATHTALLSFRAVTMDALLDAADAGFVVKDRILAQEALWILRAKHRDVRGGWSYIQEVPELPPDADDLGQVLQVLYRFGDRELASTCDDGILLALDATEANGGFNTWILDSGGETEADRLILEYLPIMGGWGIHTEVVANLLYGLLLYSPERFIVALNRAIPYFEATQHHDGFWSSKWYLGRFYGTFRVMSVIGQIAPKHPSLAKAADYLLRCQNADGGWGQRTSEPLSTAFAILGLRASLEADATAAIRRGQTYLRSTQGADGRWPSCEWISFPSRDGPVGYGSATMTTAFSLKALLVGANPKRIDVPILAPSAETA